MRGWASDSGEFDKPWPQQVSLALSSSYCTKSITCVGVRAAGRVGVPFCHQHLAGRALRQTTAR